MFNYNYLCLESDKIVFLLQSNRAISENELKEFNSIGSWRFYNSVDSLMSDIEKIKVGENGIHT